MKPLKELTRPNIWNLKPYSSAHNECGATAAKVFLDANENPYNSPYNRYPDPQQSEVKARLSKIKGVRPEQIFSATAPTRPSTCSIAALHALAETTLWP